MKFFKYLFLVLAVSGFCVLTRAKNNVIKFATLAPHDSAWMKVMEEFAKEVKKATNGEVYFKIYAGGVQGNEESVIRKIRLGQLHSGGFTGVGLGMAAPYLRVLDAPFLFDSKEEIDYIYGKFDKKFRDHIQTYECRAFKRKSQKKCGYVLLGWAEVGSIYLFTNKPIMELKDLSDVTMWIWENDPVAEAAFKNFKISPVSLSIVDVMASLETGLIDGVYGSTLSVTALQWFRKVKYMLDLPVASAGGAVLLSKKKFNELKPEHRKILLELGEKYFRKLTLSAREQNIQAIDALKKEGIKITKIQSKKAEAEFKSAGKKARLELTRKSYPKELLTQIEKALMQFRKRKSAK